MKKAAAAVLLALLIYFGPHIVLYQHLFLRTAPLRCRLLDASSGEPIAGMEVVASWNRVHCPGLLESYYKTDYTYLCRTDSRGEFFVPKKVIYRVLWGLPIFHNLGLRFNTDAFQPKGVRIFAGEKDYQSYLAFFSEGVSKENIRGLNEGKDLFSSREIRSVIRIKRDASGQAPGGAP